MLSATQDDPHENAQGGILNIVIALQEIAHLLRYRQHPLPNREVRKDMVGQMGRCQGHASCVA